MTGMMILQFLVLMFVVNGVLIFFLRKSLFDSTQGAVNRLNRETADVRSKQSELNKKLKEANQELEKRRGEADSLVAKMQEDAEKKATEEREKIIKKARVDGEEIISKAQKAQDDIRKQIEKEMEVKAVDFTALLMKEMFTQKMSVAFEQSIIDGFFEDLENIDMGVIGENINTAEVVTVAPIRDEIKTRLAVLLKKKLTRDIDITNQVDESALGGVLLRFESLSLDGTLQNLLKETSAEIKDKIEKGLLQLGED